jgi:predicted dehydrogenase
MRIIQVGVGKMGQHWLEVLGAHDDVELVGIVEPVAALRDTARAKAGLDESVAFESLDDAIASLDFDAAAVVTPPATHRPVSEQLLRAGKHVLQEKPLATSRDDAEALAAIAAETGKTLMVAQNYRHFEGYGTVKAVLESGRAGPIAAVAIRFARNTRTMFGEGDFRYQMTHPLLVDMSIHHFDRLRGLLGTNLVTVYAQSWHVPDGNYAHHAAATVQFRMDDGVPVTYVGNRRRPGTGHGRSSASVAG